MVWQSDLHNIVKNKTTKKVEKKAKAIIDKYKDNTTINEFVELRKERLKVYENKIRRILSKKNG